MSEDVKRMMEIFARYPWLKKLYPSYTEYHAKLTVLIKKLELKGNFWYDPNQKVDITHNP